MRARNLKPSLFRNELLAVSDPLHTVIFEGLWCMADREGRLEYRPARIHLDVNPGRPMDGTTRALDWLEKSGFIEVYDHSGQTYIQVNNFLKHQNPHRDERASTIPAPCKHPKSTVPIRLNPDSGILTPDSGILNPDSVPPVLRRPPRSATRRKAPEDFELTEKMLEWAEAICPNADVDAETAAFKDYTFAAGKTDWPATWRNWIRKAHKAATPTRRLTKYEESMAELHRRSSGNGNGRTESSLGTFGPNLGAQVPGPVRTITQRGMDGSPDLDQRGPGEGGAVETH